MASYLDSSIGSQLVAVLLVTLLPSGPKFVFHAPTWPGQQPLDVTAKGGRADSDSDSESDEGPDLGYGASNSGTARNGANISLHDRTHKANDSDVGNLLSGRVLGHSTAALGKLLSATQEGDGKKFELCLNGLTYIGHPINAPSDGNWSEKPSDYRRNHSNRRGDDHEAGEFLVLTQGAPEKTQVGSFTHVPDSFESSSGFVVGTSTDSNSSASGVLLEQITMFHVVFVLKKRNIQDHHHDVATVYHQIAKKLSKALHYCQKQSDFVALQSQKLLSLLAKSRQRQIDPKTLWRELAEASELAWALTELYERISRDELATFRLSGIEMSLHIKARSSEGDGHLSPLSAILLLEPKDSLLRSLSQPDTSSLTHFIREHTPTKSLYKHSTNLAIPLPEILYLAHHLLRWRKARLILPLHQRNTYILSPSLPAPLPLSLYSRAFPTLPTLPAVLKALSTKPIKFGQLIPSRNHRGTYMEILAFLVRHELVVPLRTFGWLRLVLPASSSQCSWSLPPPHSHPKSQGKRLVEPHPHHQQQQQQRHVSGTSPNILSPHLRPSSVLQDEDSMSVISDRTAIPPGMGKAGRGKGKRGSSGTVVAAAELALLQRLQFGKKEEEEGEEEEEDQGQRDVDGESEEDESAGTEEEEEEEDEDHEDEEGGKEKGEDEGGEEEEEAAALLLNPSRPSAEEVQKIAALRGSIENAELRENFEALLPFFDGRRPFEEIAARLLVKRARVEEWLAELERRRWLLVVRHT